MEDSADRHVARWRGWDEVPFDEQVEAAIMRMNLLMRHLNRATDQAIADVGMKEHEYHTLHKLMIRDTPGQASPTELAEELLVSPAAMTGRLDVLERRGLIERDRPRGDRRRVVVRITDEGRDRWRRAMRLRGRSEEQMMSVLDQAESAELNRLLKRMLLHIEGRDGAQDAAGCVALPEPDRRDRLPNQL